MILLLMNLYFDKYKCERLNPELKKVLDKILKLSAMEENRSAPE
jgi:hypothetical protein